MNTAHTALVLGAGKSGLAAARLLCAKGASVIVADQRPPAALEQETRCLKEWGAEVHWGEPRLPWGPFDVCVVSPGFAFESDWVQAAYALASVVVSELELGWSQLRARCLAVTGSNGKSTAVKWIHEGLQAAGLRSVLAGNYGRPVCDVCMTESDFDWLVLEVSSFQLETVFRFAPDIGVVLNLHPNHLDRHPSMARYGQLKSRLFSQMTSSCAAIAPQAELADWQVRAANESRRWGHRHLAQAGSDTDGPRWFGFSSDNEEGGLAESCYCCADGVVTCGRQRVADCRGTYFGTVAMASTAAAMTAAFAQTGPSVEALVAAAHAFTPLSHRLEPVYEEDGVVYVNDSKSTNSGSVAHAVRSFSNPVRLIAGGLPKESNFENLKQLLTERVKKVYLIGQAAEQMLADWAMNVECSNCGTLTEAVRQVRADAASGEVVLFSPGCASFDQYRSYNERGEHFVRLLTQQPGKE